ncbi:MAG: T9SS type A sorting domain-containing protein [Bergeyella zoohelcum]|nr:T9SS type A sorting domain-containing protein [Bergeyella zoohelcum]
MKQFLFSILFLGIFISTTGVNAQNPSPYQKDDAVVVVYPNPARDNILVKSNDNFLKIKSVTFYSILGIEVATYNINAVSGEIRLDKLKSGKYMMKYTLSNGTQKITQIIKQ